MFVRDLRYAFPKLDAWLAGGEGILITKHSKPVAKISRATEKPTPKLPLHPDYKARLKRIWGDRVFTQAEHSVHEVIGYNICISKMNGRFF